MDDINLLSHVLYYVVSIPDDQQHLLLPQWPLTPIEVDLGVHLPARPLDTILSHRPSPLRPNPGNDLGLGPRPVETTQVSERLGLQAMASIRDRLADRTGTGTGGHAVVWDDVVHFAYDNRLDQEPLKWLVAHTHSTP